MEFPRQADGSLVARLLIAIEMPLQFHVNIFSAKNGDELLQSLPPRLQTALLQCIGQRAVFIAGEADQSRGMGLQFVEAGWCQFVFRRTQLGGGYQPTEVLVSLARLHQQWIVASFGDSDFRADMCLDSALFGRQVKAGSAVHTIPVKQRHGRHFTL